MAEIKRGVYSIKTTTGLVGAKKVRKPHEAYLELSSLEIERHRLNQEKKKAAERIASINKRFEEINSKEIALHKFIEKPTPALNTGPDTDRKKKSNKATLIPTYSTPPEDIIERIITY